ncbi:benzoylformate decarboxylase [Vibrio mediterranei AK1]|uniref:thiamine pyrophosphate-binding protein n=1 Tax=Vibrio mediterranei TaxID=689 RepID=UPI00015403D0|nr:thiamine pyrophosphate-binding protein [Vibrio mediterranei]EDL55397.1 benzoylformate decarboxylase [Vibrio mediterranei AK1]
MNGKNLLLDIVEKNNIKKIYGNPGTTETPLLNELNKRQDIEYVLGLQEGVVIAAAAGYSLATGETSIVNVHTYPGVANSMCNLHNALLANSPVLVTAGQQDTRHLVLEPTLSGPLKELANTATKYSDEVTQLQDLEIKTQRAINSTQQDPRGPAFLSLPMNILDQTVEFYHSLPCEEKHHLGSIDTHTLSRATHLIESSGRIALVLDQGASVGFDELRTLAENIQADVYANGFCNVMPYDTSHYLFKGCLPPNARKQKELLSQYETLLIVGEGIGLFLYSESAQLPETVKIIHLNSSTTGINYNFPSNLSIVADIQKSLSELVKSTQHLFEPLVDQKRKLASMNGLADYRQKLADAIDENNNVEVEEAVHLIDSITNHELPVVIEASSYEGVIKSHIQRDLPNTIYGAPKGGGLGWAMPLSLGVSQGLNKPVVCYVGDGGFHYSFQALFTAANHNIPVLFICLNNNKYDVLEKLKNVQYPADQNKPIEVYNLDKPRVDYVSLAQGYGVKAARCDDYLSLNKSINAFMDNPEPTVIELLIDPLNSLEM